jgi:hypothetical protein
LYCTDSLPSCQHCTLHRCKTSTVDRASDIVARISSFDWSLRTAQNTPNRNCCRPKIKTHRHTSSKPTASRCQSCVPSRSQERVGRGCQGPGERAEATGWQGAEEHQAKGKHVDSKTMGRWLEVSGTVFLRKKLLERVLRIVF